MKTIVYAISAATLVSMSAQAAEPLAADAVKKLIAGKTVHATAAIDGGVQKTFFEAGGKAIREKGGETAEGSWMVRPNGLHCLKDLPGACAKITDNGDGTYARTLPNGTAAKWVKIVDGKDF